MEVDDRGFWRVNRTSRGGNLLLPFFKDIRQHSSSELLFIGLLVQWVFWGIGQLPFELWRAIFRKPQAPFKHQPLPKGHIRLLRVERWLPFRQVRVSLMVVDLLDVPVYQAISYTWGSNEPSHEILIDGQPFRTTASTYGALHACSNTLGPTTVWIDYVCIDQTNLIEKNEQVAIMTQIYQRSTWVSVWLGGSSRSWTGTSTLALLKVLANWKEQLSSADINQTLAIMQMTGIWNPLITLLNHPWFTRVWVIQEVVVAPEVQIVYGGTRFYLEDLYAGLDIFLDPQAASFLSSTAEGKSAYANVSWSERS
jgi:hypothetical protein